MKKNGILFPDSSDKANILREQFESVFTDEDLSSIPELPGPTHPSISSLHISSPGVAKLLSHLKINKASGPDNIPSQLFKELGEELAPCLANIFQSSIDSGKLPEDWRRAKIASAFKKGNTCQAENYRPISLTCICCKLLEHIVCRHLNDHLDQHHLLSRFQHGFRTRHLCETQLLTTVHDLMQMFDSRKQVDVAVLDFSKAFDTVPHERLLKKLSHYGIHGPILLWISAFLWDREQCVVVDGVQSGWSPMKSGVPQGTVLGPLLFLLYMTNSQKVGPENVTCIQNFQIHCFT